MRFDLSVARVIHDGDQLTANEAYDSLIDELVTDYPGVFGADESLFTMHDGQCVATDGGEAEYRFIVETDVQMDQDAELNDLYLINPTDRDRV